MGMEAVGSVSLSHCDENGNEQRNLPFEKQSESEEEEKKCECWETNTLASPIHVQVAPSADSIVYDEHQEQPPPSHHHKGKLPKKRKLKAVTEAAGPVFQGSDHNVQKITTLTTSVKDGGMKCCSDSASSDANKKDKRSQSEEPTDPVSGKPAELQSALPIPERKLLELVLDKLQKKDTYDVFSEPVDPKEVLDYYDVIKHPMDFGTIRKKLAKGVYTTLEQFEKDIFLICSNAMHYNASGTIYYKQARAIQELAKRSFQTLRLDPERLILEHKSTSNSKHSYPPKKSIKKAASGRSCFEAAGSDFASGATLATKGYRANWPDASLDDSIKERKGTASDRPGTICGYLNSTRWSFQGHSSAEHSEELSASMFKVTALKDGRRPTFWEEEHRATYKPWNLLVRANESTFSTLCGESKQLVPIGLKSEYMYARSLARFAAELGPIARKIAAYKIKNARPYDLPYSPQHVKDCKAALVDSLSCEKRNNGPNPVSSAAKLIDNSENSVKFNHGAAIQFQRNDGFAQKASIEDQPDQLTSTVVVATANSAANSDLYQLAVNRSSLPTVQSAGLHSACEPNVNLPGEGVKHNQVKSTSPSDFLVAGTKFASEVSQSRLLEIVSRNNRLMQWMPTQQLDKAQSLPTFQVTNSRNFTVDSGVTREASDILKNPSSCGGTNVAVATVETSVQYSQEGSRAVWLPQSTSQDYSMQDLNNLANSAENKMLLRLQQKNSNISVNTRQSSMPSSGTPINQENNIIKEWGRSQTVHLAHANACSGIKMQIVSDAHFNTQQIEPHVRPSSGVSQSMQQQMLLDMSSYVQSQVSRMSSQSSSISTQIISQEGAGQVFESHASNKITPLTRSQTPLRAESPRSHLHAWQGLPSQQTSDMSHSASADINVVFQKSKSPVRQSSGMLADSQQPDLALQL